MATATDSERSRLDPAKAEALLSEAARVQGESLWQDAWRRLRKNRGAWWALLFLAAFGAMSFFAPLLPLASPMALALQSEPQRPRWPWEANPRTA
ncbi:MAG TPA: hypothetical protein VJP77_09360, partial [Planctomycetota bacterium]|nr:hypothetical protein [Planctomycetota bacterium]